MSEKDSLTAQLLITAAFIVGFVVGAIFERHFL